MVGSVPGQLCIGNYLAKILSYPLLFVASDRGVFEALEVGLSLIAGKSVQKLIK